MKKRRCKQYLKLVMLLFGATFVLSSCQKDDDVGTASYHEISPKGFQVKQISFTELKNKVELQKPLNKLSKHFKSSRDIDTYSKVDANDGSFSVLTDRILEVSTDSTTVYTFLIERPTSALSDFENFVLFINSNNYYSLFIYRYINNGCTDELPYNITKESISEEQISLGELQDYTQSRTAVVEMGPNGCAWSYTLNCMDYETVEVDCFYVLMGVECPSNNNGGDDSNGDSGYNYDGGGINGNDSDNNESYNTDPSSGGSHSGESTTPNNELPVGVIAPTMAAQLAMYLDLTPEQAFWANKQEPETIKEITDYLFVNCAQDYNSNSCQGAQDFALQALDAFMNEGEVDFEEELILDSDLKDNDCLYSVYTGMGNAPTFANYLNNFDGDMSVANLKLTSNTTLPNITNAETSAPQNYLITITFNENNLNRPNLSIARTFIHEIIHAEIFRKLLSVAQHPSIQLDQNQLIQLRNDYLGLYDYYMRWKWNVPQGQSPSSAQHEAMAQHYRDIIEQALEEFDNSQTSEVYEALAWTGLQNTVAWNSLSQTERDNINQTVTDFYANNPNCQ